MRHSLDMPSIANIIHMTSPPLPRIHLTDFVSQVGERDGMSWQRVGALGLHTSSTSSIHF